MPVLTSETENRRTDDGRYVDALTIEDISVHRKLSCFPFAFSPNVDQAADGFGAGRPVCPEAGSQTEIVAESHQAGENLPKLDESF